MSKTKQEIVNEIIQMNDACSWVIDDCPPGDPRMAAAMAVFNYIPGIPGSHEPTLSDINDKLFGPNNNDGWINDLASEVNNMQAETVTEYVVREEPVMSKLNLILSSC